jgi:hypothetical protein
MSDIRETSTQQGTTEYKQITTPNFLEIVFEIEKHVNNGWAVSQEAYPFANIMGLYEVNFYKNAKTINLAAERVQAAVEGKGVWTKDKKVENMNKARETRMANLEKKKAAEAKNEG